jgi:acetyl esterase/lipase
MMEYTLQNSVNEIVCGDLIAHGFYFFCPDIFIQLLTDEQKDKPLEEVKKQVSMPWGVPFLSELVVQSANLLNRMEEEDSFEFVPLWSERTEEKWYPAWGDRKDSAFLLCRKPDVCSSQTVRPAALVCAGGGYETVDLENEGFRTACALEENGYRVFIIRYRVAPNHYPEPQKDLALAIKYIRNHAEVYSLNPDDLLLVGFSAGGHLVASETLYADEIDDLLMQELKKDHPSLAERYEGISVKANKICLSYPVISMTSEVHEGSVRVLTQGDERLKDKLSIELHADKTYPKTFIWANDDDDLVPPSNAGRLAERLNSSGAEVMYRTYPEGGHGVGLGTGLCCDSWLGEMIHWMKQDPHGSSPHKLCE